MIALDTSTDGGNNGGAATTLTFSHSAGATATIVFVHVAASAAITGVTYDGVAMTSGVSSGNQAIYYLVSPPQGSKSVVVTCGSSTNIIGRAVSYTGTATSDVINATQTQTNNGISNGSWQSITTTTVNENCWVIMGNTHTSTGNPSVGSGCASRVSSNGMGTFDSNAAKNPAGAVTMNTLAFDGTQNWTNIAIAFAPNTPLIDTVVTSQTTGTTAITVANKLNRKLVVSFATYQGGGPSGITAGGVAMTKVAEMVGSFNEQCSIWELVNPATGAQNVVLSGVGGYYAIGIYSLFNCKQALSTNVSTTGNNNSTASLSLTTLKNNSMIIACIEPEPVPTMTTSGGVQDWIQTAASYNNAQGQHYIQATAGAKTMSSTLAYGARWNMINVEIEEANAVDPGQPAAKRIATVPFLAGSRRAFNF